ncbi:MAG TPA: tetratricopeptide repeat protein [Ktedonobacteraceae bacterium]|nr:tetratricopeptide repeat protein [Ktedonobacteraceae bacterium]
MTQALSAEEKARLKKQWTELAIRQALESLWAEAIETNRSILSLFPNEPEAYNRLGKAYSELGQYEEARRAYGQTLKYSPNNTIAKRQLDRLAQLQEIPSATHGSAESIDPRLFNEDPGKTGITELLNLAQASILAKVGVGDKAHLHVSGHTLLVRNGAGEDIGQVEPRLANRLIGFMEGGNRYSAGILTIESGLVRIIMREAYQHPSMFGKVSFPSQGSGDMIRAYIKDSMLRYDRDDDEDMLNDDEYFDGGDEPEELTEVDFESSNMDTEE